MCSLCGKQLYTHAAAIQEPGSTVVHVYAGFVYHCCYNAATFKNRRKVKISLPVSLFWCGKLPTGSSVVFGVPNEYLVFILRAIS